MTHSSRTHGDFCEKFYHHHPQHKEGVLGYFYRNRRCLLNSLSTVLNVGVAKLLHFTHTYRFPKKVTYIMILSFFLLSSDSVLLCSLNMTYHYKKSLWVLCLMSGFLWFFGSPDGAPQKMPHNFGISHAFGVNSFDSTFEHQGLPIHAKNQVKIAWRGKMSRFSKIKKT